MGEPNVQADPLRYPCDECERSYTTKDNLKQHKKKKHPKATEVDFISYDCANCGKIFANNKELTEHRSRERGGVTTGCDAKSKASSSKVGSSKAGSSITDLFPDETLSSVASETPSIDDVREDDPVFASNREKGFNELDRDRANCSWAELASVLKSANDRLVQGQTIATGNANKVIHKTPGYLLGAAEAIIKSVKNHQDFARKTEKPLTDAAVIVFESRKRRDDMLMDIAVTPTQSNALHLHSCEGSNCPPGCTYLRRRIGLHRQQILLGLVAISELYGKISSPTWRKFLEEHLR